MTELELIHICTTESFRAGLEEFPPTECNVCGHETVYMDWVGSLCDTCGADSAWDSLPGYMRGIRYKTGLSRSEIAGKLGYTRSTVKTYEFTKVSDVYWAKFKVFIKEFYSERK